MTSEYGSWEEWHKRVDEEGRTVNFNVYGTDDTDPGMRQPGGELKAWMDMHLDYLSQFASVGYIPVPTNKQLVQAEVSRD